MTYTNSMLPLQLNFLGTFHVVLAQQPISSFRSAKVQGVLVYLALQNKRPFPRDFLATLFWPEEPERVAQKNLRQALYQLRKILNDNNSQEQPYLLVTRQTVQFNRDSNHTLDVNQFLDTLHNDNLETAVSLYQGDLLPGFTCNSLLFEEWLLTTRESLHRNALEAFFKYTEQLLQQREFARARSFAQEQLVLEPWREEAHRQLMQALALSGERSAALSQFETCSRILDEELGTAPSELTVSLYEQILTAEKCADLGLTDAITTQHSDYFLTFVANQAEALVGENPQEPALQIAAELDNVRKGWDTAVNNQASELILACAPALANFYQIRGLYQEGERLFSQAAQAFNIHSERNIYGRLITQQAGLFVRLSAYQPAITLIEKALQIAEQTEDSWLLSRLHITWGEALWRQGNLDTAEDQLQHALQIAQAHQFLPLLGFANFHLGVVSDYRSQRKEALTFFEQALAIWQQVGNRRQQGFTLNSIGAVARHLPDKQKAEIALSEALLISQTNDDLLGQSMVLNNLSLLAIETSSFKAAQLYLLQALELATFSGDEFSQAILTFNLGWNAMQAGQLVEAQEFAQSALLLRRKIGDQRGEGVTLSLLGSLAQKNGRISESRDFYQSALRLSQLVGDRDTEKEVMLALKILID